VFFISLFMLSVTSEAASSIYTFEGTFTGFENSNPDVTFEELGIALGDKHVYSFEVAFDRDASTVSDSSSISDFFYSDLLGQSVVAQKLNGISPEEHHSFDAYFLSTGATVGELVGGSFVRILSDLRVESWAAGQKFTFSDGAVPSIGGNAVYLNGDATLLSIKSAPKPSTQKDQELVVRYYTLEYPADRLVLKANETAILDGTIPFDLPYNWVNLLYTKGTNLPVDLYVPLGLGLGILIDPDPIMPLPGPAVITLNTNLPNDGPSYTGAAGLKVLRKIPIRRHTEAGHPNPSSFERYSTLTKPTDKVILRANETAIIVGTTNICDLCNYMNILYRKETNDFLNIILPLGLTDGTMPLSGPGVVMLNTNDASFYGALYTGALQLKIIQTKDARLSAGYHINRALKHPGPLGPYYTLAYPDDRLVLKANETAIIDSTVGYDWPFTWVNILYKRGTNDFSNMALPLGLTGGTMPLSGPGVVMLNTNDANIFGAVYTGAVGLRIVRTIHRNESK